MYTPPLPPPSDRPVVALDIDGVLNVDAPGPDAEKVKLTVEAHMAPPSGLLRGGGWNTVQPTVTVDPEHGAWIKDLTNRADVVWVTSWEHTANIYYAPLLDISPLPVVEVHRFYSPAADGDGADAKAAALATLFPARPLVWIDDATWNYTSTAHWRAFGHTVPHQVAPQFALWPTLVPQVGMRNGLKRSVRDQVDTWLNNLPTQPNMTTQQALAVVGGSWDVTLESKKKLKLHHRNSRGWLVDVDGDILDIFTNLNVSEPVFATTPSRSQKQLGVVKELRWSGETPWTAEQFDLSGHDTYVYPPEVMSALHGEVLEVADKLGIQNAVVKPEYGNQGISGIFELGEKFRFDTVANTLYVSAIPTGMLSRDVGSAQGMWEGASVAQILSTAVQIASQWK